MTIDVLADYVSTIGMAIVFCLGFIAGNRR
jgi:hypothetical protein